MNTLVKIKNPQGGNEESNSLGNTFVHKVIHVFLLQKFFNNYIRNNS